LRHEARLRHFLGRLAGPADGDDLAQEAFVRAWQRAADFRGEGRYGAWLTGIGWRLFLDRHRTRRRQHALFGSFDAPTSERPHDATDARLDADRLLAVLSPQERAAMLLCLGHGWSHGEAAAIMGVPLGSLKSLVQRGRARIMATPAAQEHDA
jgi:RNA polymerase sigma factor (sigma-70 family)